jgi:hypothetical protein
VRFLWRCKRSFLRRLCLLILAFRRFFNEPIIMRLFCCAVALALLCCKSARMQLYGQIDRWCKTAEYSPQGQGLKQQSFLRVDLIYNLIERIFNNTLGAGGFQSGDQLANHVLVNDRLHRHPAFEAQAGNRRIPQGGQ